jgi:pimeloyl-ACP methyl ester carboxylesterase
MARIVVSGIEIDYELLGPKNAFTVVITPGGRYPRLTPGVPQLGSALAEGGYRVLMWDRPNCGASDISFAGRSESTLHAETLLGLAGALELGPVALVAGSAGSRVSLLAAVRARELVSKMALWWISGGPISLAQLAGYYCGDSAIAAAKGGMEAVAALPSWAAQLTANPRNREILLALDPDEFISRMQQWAGAYGYSDISPVPGTNPEELARLSMPILVFRSGKSDISHPRRTSEWVHELLPNSRIIDPPWPDQEWNNCQAIPAEPGRGRFERWPMLAPILLEFLRG